MISDTLQKKINEAMKARDEVKLSTYRMLHSALSYEKIAKQRELNEEEELTVVRSEAKKRKDAIEAYSKANQIERADKEKKELELLEDYLPAQMEDQELESLVESAIQDTGASSMADMGKVIGSVMAKAQGRADGSRVSALVKSKLNK